MLINALHSEESRVAIVEDGILVELGVETAIAARHKGNVYKGTIVRVEPSLQVAFVEYGEKKNGFLPMREIHPSYFKKKISRGTPKIQDVINKGLEVLVQVVREERDQKGAYMTTHLSIPGRFLVLMPGSTSGGISRKIEDEEERKALKQTLKELNPPKGMGVIVRTAGLGMSRSVLSKDLKFLLKIWDQVLQDGTRKEAPALIYRESDLIIRTIRDYFSTDIEEILIDNIDVFKSTLNFFKQVMPRYRNRVKLYQGVRPIFTKYNLEEQIERIYQIKVPLKSGGSIVLEPTEALVSIDVNSGKSMRGKNVEETAFRTNIEAAEEIARQLRLRDLAGLIVIDFIDMFNRKHKLEVVKNLRQFLKYDKAKTSFSAISKFGILELSRQRMRAPVEQGTYISCPHCIGRGRVKSKEAVALAILRNIQMHLAKGGIAEVNGELSVELADFLHNRKRAEIMKMEQTQGVRITLTGKRELLSSQYHLEVVPKAEEPVTPEKEPEPQKKSDGIQGGESQGTDEGKKKKKVSRWKSPKKKKVPPRQKPSAQPSGTA
jgi:ribonuclease E